MEQKSEIENIKLELTLNVAEVNTILAALGAQPHDAVRGVIDNIISQAAPQYQKQVGEVITTSVE